MNNLRSVIESQVHTLANELASVIRQQVMDEVHAQVRAQVLGEIRGMSLHEIIAMTSGSETGNGGPAVKRGPGRPKKTAAAAAPRGAARRAAAPKAAAPKAVAPKAATGAKPKKLASGRLARRSMNDIEATLDQISALLRKSPGLRSEQIGSQLALDKKELPRPLAEGLKRGGLTKKGQKRATTYFVAGGGGSSAGAKKGKKGR